VPSVLMIHPRPLGLDSGSGGGAPGSLYARLLNRCRSGILAAESRTAPLPRRWTRRESREEPEVWLCTVVDMEALGCWGTS
jgi:hypothetical protein